MKKVTRLLFALFLSALGFAAVVPSAFSQTVVDADNDGIPDNTERVRLLTITGFENVENLNNGNNIGADISPWIPGGGSQANVVQVDGPGGYEYGAGGPESDAEAGTEAGELQRYLDITDGANDFYQTFTIDEATQLNFSGYFSSRNAGPGDPSPALGQGSIRILEGTGLDGAEVAATGTVTVQDNTAWTLITQTTPISPGTYSFVVSMDNGLNFDNAAATIPIDTDNDSTSDDQDTDADGDGILDSVEVGADRFNPVDSDGDGFTDYVDIDKDDDGIPDNVEAQATAEYRPPTGNDADGDGIDDAYDADSGAPQNGLAQIDTDGDGTPDALDQDSDDDNISDYVEADADGNILLVGTDADRDGLDDGRGGALDTYDLNNPPAQGQNATGSAYNFAALSDADDNGEFDFRQADTDLRAGWRMYAPPYVGLTVNDLAQQNLVQSIDGGQYADAPVAPNLYDGYDGGYAPQNTEADGCRVDESIEQDDFQDDANAAWDCPTDFATELESGEGFLWYIFDQQIAAETVPVGTFAWNPAGTAPEGDFTLAEDEDVLEPDEEFHFLGNPFPGPDANAPFVGGFDLTALNIGPDGLDADGDGLPDFCSVVQVWDPNAGTSGEYVPIVQGDTNGFTGGRVAPLQGFFVERRDFDVGGAQTDLTFLRSGVTAEATPFIGITRPASTTTSARPRRLVAGGNVSQQSASMSVVSFRLEREAAGGSLAGGQAQLVLASGATTGDDAFEASALVPIAERYAVPAFRRTAEASSRANEGARVNLKSVASLPLGLEEVGVQELELVVAAHGVEAEERLVLRWPRIENVPEEWTLELTDRATGETIDLRAARSHPFALSEGASLGGGGSLMRLGSGAGAGAITALIEQAVATPVQAGSRQRGTSAQAGSASARQQATASTRKGAPADFGTSLSAAHAAGDQQVLRSAARFVLRVGPAGEAETPGSEKGGMTERYVLAAPYPNPASSGRATIEYAAREAGDQVRIELYNVLGQRVSVLREGPVRQPGQRQRLAFSTSGLPSGLYVVRLTGEAGQRTQTLTIVR